VSLDNWQRVAQLFHQALEKSAEKRQRFLREACGDDLDLLRTVASLLEADEEAGEFLESAPRISEALEDSGEGRDG